MEQDKLITRYDGAVLLLPPKLRECARVLNKKERMTAEEIRLRVGHKMTIAIQEEERSLNSEEVTLHDIDTVIELATGASAYSSLSQIREGFVTARGGYRVGICGNIAVLNGHTAGFRTISSVAIRISRQIEGIAKPVLEEMGTFDSTLIISPPGGGKTTLLRDMVRLISDGFGKNAPSRVALADERGEVAAMAGGIPQMDIGKYTDVMDGCPKAEAMIMMLRAMNPQIIALDEITAAEDISAMIQAKNCGVKLLATAHANDVKDLIKRPLYRRLLREEVFENIVTIQRVQGERKFTVQRSGDIC